MKVLECTNLTAWYGDKQVLTDVNFSLEKGTFTILCGRNASGKSTLLKVLRKLDTYYGIRQKGEIKLNGKRINEVEAENLNEVGIIFDTPKEQLLELKVERDIISPGIYKGFPWNEIKRRFEFIVKQMRIEHLLKQDTDKLSNGETQKIALASQSFLNPCLLLLDEPTSNLDPISRNELLSFLKSLTKEGLTLLMISHRLDEEARWAQKLLFLNNGRIELEDKPETVLKNPKFYKNYPPRGPLLLSYKLKDFIIDLNELPNYFKFEDKIVGDDNISDWVIRFENINVQYPNGYPALKNLSFKIPRDRISCIFGPCGSGKSSIARACLKALKIKKGKIIIDGKSLLDYKEEDLYRKIFYIPQNPKELFFEPTVKEEVLFGLENKGIGKDCAYEALKKLGLDELKDEEPETLSFGQQRLLTIAIAYANKPKIIFFDEPELALDPHSLKGLIDTLLQLKSEGLTIIILTHDVTTFAYLAEWNIILKEGKVLTEGNYRVFKREDLLKEANLIKPLFIPEIFETELKPPITWEEIASFLVK